MSRTSSGPNKELRTSSGFPMSVERPKHSGCLWLLSRHIHRELWHLGFEQIVYGILWLQAVTSLAMPQCCYPKQNKTILFVAETQRHKRLPTDLLTKCTKVFEIEARSQEHNLGLAMWQKPSYLVQHHCLPRVLFSRSWSQRQVENQNQVWGWHINIWDKHLFLNIIISNMVISPWFMYLGT